MQDPVATCMYALACKIISVQNIQSNRKAIRETGLSHIQQQSLASTSIKTLNNTLTLKRHGLIKPRKEKDGYSDVRTIFLCSLRDVNFENTERETSEQGPFACCIDIICMR